MILVGCGKAKLDRAAPARDLYTGSLFRAARAYSEVSAGYEPWAIVSGKHGLLAPSDIVEPYEQRAPRGVWGRQRWAESVALQLGQRHPRELVAVLLMGADYAEPLEKALLRRGWDVMQPLRGKGLGERLRWLSQATKQLRGAR